MNLLYNIIRWDMIMSMRIIKRKYELNEIEWKIKMINNSRDKKESIWRGLRSPWRLLYGSDRWKVMDQF